MINIVKTSTSIPADEVSFAIDDFLTKFTPLETLNGSNLLMLHDEKSGTFYLPCHMRAIDFCEFADFEATIDGTDEDELYKLNRDTTQNDSAYNNMVSDAKAGRSFEDIVVEFDTAYNPDKPLKIYGGQHRIKAIQSALIDKPNVYHGFRVYFGLTKQQKVEIATINNTSIAVSNDLLDRMREQLLGSELRDFFQKVNLLASNQDFSDKKDAIIPTVRVARTFVVNYLKGRNAKNNEFHIPVICKSGGIDEEYINARGVVDWNDEDFLEAGRNFAALHQTQRLKVTSRKGDNFAQFASKAISLAVTASWSYAAGYYLKDKNQLEILYSITKNLGQAEDPLNAKALSEARLKGIDPDTYRGLGARNSPDELGRMLEVFIVYVERASEKKITKNLANAAIQAYEAKKASNNAEKFLSKI